LGSHHRENFDYNDIDRLHRSRADSALIGDLVVMEPKVGGSESDRHDP